RPHPELLDRRTALHGRRPRLQIRLWRRAMSAPPLSVADTVTVLRRRYPDSLVCVECGLLLATRRESYAKSNLTEGDRLSYVCSSAASIVRRLSGSTRVGWRRLGMLARLPRRPAA